MSLVKPVTTSLNRRRKIAIDTQFEMGVLPNKVVKNSLSFWKQKIKMHDNACGIGIYDKNLSDFHKYANKELADINFGENWYEVNFERIAADKDIADLIDDLTQHDNIWGQHNNEPMIHVTDINITSADVQIMGKNQDTVKIFKNGVAYMFFKCKDRIDDFKRFKQMKINVVGRANMNEWMGNFTPQIFVSDFEVSDDSLGF